MSAQEVAWRVRAALRDGCDRWRYPRLRAKAAADTLNDTTSANGQGYSTTDVPVGGVGAACAVDHLRAQADMIASGRLSFFNLNACDLGRPIDWSRDHESGRRGPSRFAAAIDYRDFAAVGDAKLVWEPSRHHQLVVLGRAYRASGERRYAQAACTLWTSWLDQCPFGLGMNWRSPLELAVRLINWVWALDLIRPSGLPDAALRTRLLNSVYLHLWDITRKYSRGSSANNHLIGEAAGVYCAARYFPGLRNAARWAAEAQALLCDEIHAQSYPDGGSREQALGYQGFVIQFLTLAGLIGGRTATPFPDEYWDRLERMYEFGAASLAGGPAPLFGDYDDGYVLDLGRAGGDWQAWLAVAAVLFGRSDFKAAAGAYSECAEWLFGAGGRALYANLPAATDAALKSRAFPDSGYYLLQHGRAGSPEALSVLFDCGDLGFGPLAAHGHADALSFTLRAFGVDVLVDPGTYDYFAYPAWRSYFRSTRAHNTVTVDGLDQSVMSGPFMWCARATPTCVAWEPGAHSGRVIGDHNGYVRLADPTLHRRTLELDGPARVLTIQDEVLASRKHDVAVHFHFAEHCTVRAVTSHRLAIDTGRGSLTLELDPRLRVSRWCGSTDPIGGWVSPRYHELRPTVTIVGRCLAEGNLRLRHRMEVGMPHSDAAFADAVPQPVEAVRGARVATPVVGQRYSP